MFFIFENIIHLMYWLLIHICLFFYLTLLYPYLILEKLNWLTCACEFLLLLLRKFSHIKNMRVLIFIAHVGIFGCCVVVSPIIMTSKLFDLGLYLLAWMMKANTKMITLNGTHYYLWKRKMKGILFVKQLHIRLKIH